MKEKLYKGDRVILKSDPKGFYQFLEYCPKNYEGYKMPTCKVVIFANSDFAVGRVGLFPVSKVHKYKP